MQFMAAKSSWPRYRYTHCRLTLKAAKNYSKILANNFIELGQVLRLKHPTSPVPMIPSFGESVWGLGWQLADLPGDAFWALHTFRGTGSPCLPCRRANVYKCCVVAQSPLNILIWFNIKRHGDGAERDRDNKGLQNAFIASDRRRPKLRILSKCFE